MMSHFLHLCLLQEHFATQKMNTHAHTHTHTNTRTHAHTSVGRGVVSVRAGGGAAEKSLRAASWWGIHYKNIYILYWNV